MSAKKNTRDGFATNAAIEMTGATICAPNKKVMTGMSKLAAPPAATVLKNQAKNPKMESSRKNIGEI